MKRIRCAAALLLALLICVSLLPAEARADCTVHDLYQYAYKLPTCTASGDYVLLCRNCDYVEIVELAPTGHSFDVVAIEPATCTTNGTRYKECTNCQEQWTETIPAEGHNWGAWRFSPRPTCVKAGRRLRECSKCENIQSETLPATGKHSFGAWMVVTPATCTEEGIRARECDCGYTEREAIPATGKHSFGAWMVVTPANCMDEGIKARECDCGYTERAAIPVTDHAWDEGFVAAQPSVTSEGFMLYVCTACGMERTRSIPRLAAGGTEKPAQTEPVSEPEASAPIDSELSEASPKPDTRERNAEKGKLSDKLNPQESLPDQSAADSEKTGLPTWIMYLGSVSAICIAAAVIIIISVRKRKHRTGG